MEAANALTRLCVASPCDTHHISCVGLGLVHLWGSGWGLVLNLLVLGDDIPYNLGTTNVAWAKCNDNVNYQSLKYIVDFAKMALLITD